MIKEETFYGLNCPFCGKQYNFNDHNYFERDVAIMYATEYECEDDQWDEVDGVPICNECKDIEMAKIDPKVEIYPESKFYSIHCDACGSPLADDNGHVEAYADKHLIIDSTLS